MECRLCPRECGADRGKGEVGFCGAGQHIRAARAALHMWEEPCISGVRGSGAVFFSGCPLGCVFCQNADISQRNYGTDISAAQLAKIFERLENSGAHNINLVSPTPFCKEIINSLEIYRPHIPIVYNTSGYEKIETLEMMAPYVDIYLPDLKYFSADISKKYSNAADYFAYASRAVLFMLSQKPKAIFDDAGVMQSGVIIRHLVLPGNIRQTYLLVDWLRENIPHDTFISLMCQYFPAGRAAEFKEINRHLTSGEYERACNYLVNAGFENGFFQDRTSAKEEFVPSFDLTGVCE